MSENDSSGTAPPIEYFKFHGLTGKMDVGVAATESTTWATVVVTIGNNGRTGTCLEGQRRAGAGNRQCR